MNAPRFYAQHGEDVVLWHALGRSEAPRFFVEVGVIDGRRYSNTLAFEERGWRGVCVEAHPDYVELARRNRPASRVVHAAACDREAESAPFHAEPRGALSSLAPRDESLMREKYGAWFAGFTTVEVPLRTLDRILREADAPTGLELVSIDVEGSELAVLAGFDLARWRPRVVIAEANDAESAAALCSFMGAAGYELARAIGGANHLFARSLVDVRALRDARIDSPYVHTRHPIDGAGPDQWVTAQEPRPGALRRLARAFARTSG
jgi:FkbM family methyltransferase